MSSSPDGGVTCSVAKSKAHGLAARHVNEVLRADPTAAQSEVATCRSDGSDDGNAICAGFGLGCIKLGCEVPSSEPDGGVTAPADRTSDTPGLSNDVRRVMSGHLSADQGCLLHLPIVLQNYFECPSTQF